MSATVSLDLLPINMLGEILHYLADNDIYRLKLVNQRLCRAVQDIQRFIRQPTYHLHKMLMHILRLGRWEQKDSWSDDAYVLQTAKRIRKVTVDMEHLECLLNVFGDCLFLNLMGPMLPVAALVKFFRHLSNVRHITFTALAWHERVRGGQMTRERRADRLALDLLHIPRDEQASSATTNLFPELRSIHWYLAGADVYRLLDAPLAQQLAELLLPPSFNQVHMTRGCGPIYPQSLKRLTLINISQISIQPVSPQLPSSLDHLTLTGQDPSISPHWQRALLSFVNFEHIRSLELALRLDFDHISLNLLRRLPVGLKRLHLELLTSATFRLPIVLAEDEYILPATLTDLMLVTNVPSIMEAMRFAPPSLTSNVSAPSERHVTLAAPYGLSLSRLQHLTTQCASLCLVSSQSAYTDLKLTSARQLFVDTLAKDVTLTHVQQLCSFPCMIDKHGDISQKQLTRLQPCALPSALEKLIMNGAVLIPEGEVLNFPTNLKHIHIERFFVSEDSRDWLLAGLVRLRDAVVRGERRLTYFFLRMTSLNEDQNFCLQFCSIVLEIQAALICNR